MDPSYGYHGCVTQLEEYSTLNREAGGSSPPAPTRFEKEKKLAHKYTILVVSKEDGDFQTEDDLMQQIQEFAMELRNRNKEKAFVLVGTEFGVDPNEYAKSLETAKKVSDASP